MLDCRAAGPAGDGEGAISWDLMAWGFTHGGFGGKASGSWCMKNATHLCQEVSEVVALGGAVMVYAKPERSGRLVSWHHDVLAEVAAFSRERKDVCFRSRTVPEAAVLHLASHYYATNSPLFNYGDAVEPVEGALTARPIYLRRRLRSRESASTSSWWSPSRRGSRARCSLRSRNTRAGAGTS